MSKDTSTSDLDLDSMIDRYFEWLDSDFVPGGLLGAYQDLIEAFDSVALAMVADDESSRESIDEIFRALDPEIDAAELTDREMLIRSGKTRYHYLGWLSDAGHSYVFGRLLARACRASDRILGFDGHEPENIARGFSIEMLR